MIYIIADTHGEKKRLKKLRLKKSDVLIICGDFGFIWEGTKAEKRLLKRLGKRRYPILFIDGVHENHQLLHEYPEEQWQGGMTRHIGGNLRLLKRGEVFEIGGKKILALGGGQPDEYDMALGSENRKLAFPCDEDYETLERSIKKCNAEVDIVVSFEPPSMIADFLELPHSDRQYMSTYLDKADKEVKFGKWFFGGHHMNKIISTKYCAVFDKPQKIE